VRYRYDDYQIVSCERCTLWRACPRLSASELERYYEQEYYSEQLAGSGAYDAWREANRHVWRRSAELVRDEAVRRLGLAAVDVRLLDVGCGQGFFLEECAGLGMSVRGIEPSPHAVQYAQTQMGLDVRALTPDRLPRRERYHVITLWEVLEHVPDPLATLRLLYAHLEPGGQLWVAVPNLNALARRFHGQEYFNLRNKSHLTHFDRHTLRRALEEAGFADVRRVVHFGGGGRAGVGAVLQYAGRAMCLGTDLRFVAARTTLDQEVPLRLPTEAAWAQPGRATAA
jgi:2-polyprenyl-3-methyl-5-hydroxy-6-metoxy-1,4-benzoquinol methylase